MIKIVGDRAKKTNYSKRDNDYCICRSIRKAVFEILDENPHLLRRQIIEVLREKYGIVNVNKQTISNYKQDFKRRNHILGLPLKPHKRVFRWENVSGDRERALKCGWFSARNRNSMLVFRHPFGSVHWYKKGSVCLYLNRSFKPPNWLARVKHLFCRAFEFLVSEELLLSCMEGSPREVGRHMVFDVGAPMPRFKIDYYKKSHGLTVYSDGSHPTAVEVSETIPIWLKHFKEQIKEHLKLIKMYQAESEARRKAYEADRMMGERLHRRRFVE